GRTYALGVPGRPGPAGCSARRGRSAPPGPGCGAPGRPGDRSGVNVVPGATRNHPRPFLPRGATRTTGRDAGAGVPGVTGAPAGAKGAHAGLVKPGAKARVIGTGQEMSVWAKARPAWRSMIGPRNQPRPDRRRGAGLARGDGRPARAEEP